MVESGGKASRGGVSLGEGESVTESRRVLARGQGNASVAIELQGLDWRDPTGIPDDVAYETDVLPKLSRRLTGNLL